MTESELRKKFLAWWQPLNPNGRLWKNQTGFFLSFDGVRIIPCGIPTPKRGKDKKSSGGGSDLLGWSNDGHFMAREIKTIDDKLKNHQADFLSLVKRSNGDAGLILENPYNKLGFDEIQWKENLRYLIK